MNKRKFKKLLDKYVNNKSKSPENQLLEEFFDIYRTEITDFEMELTGKDQHLKEEIKSRILQKWGMGTVNGNKKPNRSNSSWLISIKAAAVYAFLIVAAYFTLIYNGKVEESMDAETLEWIIKENPWGQKTTIFLSDSSEVVLNSGSKLSYNSEFKEKDRTLFLEGEAYFKVAKNASKPFKVITGELTTVALGTEFDIRAYKDEPLTVALVSGKVSLNHTQKGNGIMVLEPGEAVTIDTSHWDFEKFNFDVKEHTAWTDGIIYFKEATEKQVLEKLERWYGVVIRIEKASSKPWKFSGEFRRKSLENVLISMGHAKNFTSEIKKDTVIIKYK